MSRQFSRKGIALVAVLAATVVLCGCEPDDPNAVAASGTASSAKPAAGARPPNGAQADMVAAVSVKPGPGVVDLRFSIVKRPKVGEPVDIELAMIPSVELERLFARFQVTDGLQLVSGGETDHLEHPAAGVALGHKVTVVANADGIFYITAVVLADSEKDSVARTFTIPIIAGQGLAELPAAPPAASVAGPERQAARP